jgi:hypothetical protein
MHNLKLPLLITLILLTGCVATAGSDLQVKGAVTNPCGFISLAEYDQAFNQELEKEIASAPGGYVWPRAISDYHNLRKAVLACKGG